MIIVDMQNDFVHPEGGIAFRAAENPAQASTYHSYRAPIPHVKQLAGALRAAGRPVVYVTHVVRADRSDAHYP
jgi:nicotinamidase-related amidase